MLYISPVYRSYLKFQPAFVLYLFIVINLCQPIACADLQLEHALLFIIVNNSLLFILGNRINILRYILANIQFRLTCFQPVFVLYLFIVINLCQPIACAAAINKTSPSECRQRVFIPVVNIELMMMMIAPNSRARRVEGGGGVWRNLRGGGGEC